MPIYEYKCSKCHEISEALQKFSDPPLSKCPHCGGKAQRIMSLGAFHLKGNGWYTTDYAGKNSSTLNNKEGVGEACKAESSDKAEAKPAKKESAVSAD